MKKLFFLTIFIISLSSYCQQLYSIKKYPTNKVSLDSMINKIITKKYYVNETEELRVIFTFKIDSLGEIHSAHIRRSKNLKQENYYNICHEIEKDIVAKFLYNQFKDNKIIQKYVSCDYPFTSKK
jgi:hypothetical protein